MKVSAVQIVEANCCMHKVSNQKDEISFQKAIDELHLRTIDNKNLTDNDFEIQSYLNPTSMDCVTLEIRGINDAVIQVVITGLHGKAIMNQTTNMG